METLSVGDIFKWVEYPEYYTVIGFEKPTNGRGITWVQVQNSKIRNLSLNLYYVESLLDEGKIEIRGILKKNNIKHKFIQNG